MTGKIKFFDWKRDLVLLPEMMAKIISSDMVE